MSKEINDDDFIKPKAPPVLNVSQVSGAGEGFTKSNNLLFANATAEFQSVVKVRNFGGEAGGEEEDPDDIWSFPIGWNRKIDNETGLSKEPQDMRFLSNAI